jgi:dipeptidyl aminopeptidase/acylaminoacyl peptidase
MRIKSVLLGAVFVAASVAAADAQPAAGPAGSGPRIPTASDFGRLAAISSISLSPDGKHIAAITTPDGVTSYISVWSTDAMDQKPYVINPTNLEGFQFFGVDFVKNDRLYVTFRQLVTGVSGGAASGGKNQFYVFQSVLVSPSKDGPPLANVITHSKKDTSDNDPFLDRGARIRLVSRLPNDPRRILVFDGDKEGGLFKVDVLNGQIELVQRGSDRYNYFVDAKSDPRGRVWFTGDEKQLHVMYEFKNPKTGAWDEAFRYFIKDRRAVSFAGYDDDPSLVYATSDSDQEHTVIADYDISGHKPPEVAFAHPLFDASGVVTSGRASDYHHVLGYRYAADAEQIYWTDGQFEALQKSLREALGVQRDVIDWTDPGTGKRAKISIMHDFDAAIVDYSDDMSRVVVAKSGPSQPPEYYLLKDGKTLTLLGKAAPQIDIATLGHTTLAEYPARDGLMIPAFVTTPSKAIYGAGPYPTIVTPHGGPWARDYLEWDVTGWTQYFAARGYAVIQPQYRGSEGWGQTLWRAGDAQWGGKMEDDMEDGVKWLIAQGVADPKHIAIHGYSYGGYAAFDAAVRPNGMYRCAIAGAGVAELAKFRETISRSDFGRAAQLETVQGVSPLEHTADVQVPVLAYHGDTDHTVPRTESERFTNALAAEHKPYKFVELPNLDHQINYWTPQNWRDILLTVDDFLKTSCQMGGR